MADELAADVTLASLTGGLNEREEYLRKVFLAMSKERKSRGDILVRIGRSGTDEMPDYRFDAPDGTPLVFYNGKQHAPWGGVREHREPGDWSTATWTYDQVADLLGTIRSSGG